MAALQIQPEARAPDRQGLVQDLAAREVAVFFARGLSAASGHSLPNCILGIGDAPAAPWPAPAGVPAQRGLVSRQRVIGHDFALRADPSHLVFSERLVTLASPGATPVAVQAMLDRAVERRWWCVWIQGSVDFVRLASLAALSRGIALGSEPACG